VRPALECLDARYLPSVLTPAQVTHAYGLDAITFNSGGQTVKGDGSGQTIAIVDAFHDPYLASDLHTFDQTYNLPDPQLAQVNLAGGKTNDGWAGEETLDVEWAHAIAPGAKIVVVEAKSTNRQDMMGAVDVARNLPGVSVVSMSWGMGEFSGMNAADRHFVTPAGHNGVTFTSASGDEGAAGGAEWPASSLDVLAVGGTTLLSDSAGNYQGEIAWSGSSGGFSHFEAEPSFQRSVQSSGRRNTPDVSFVADPFTGVAVYTTLPSVAIGAWSAVGGTSVGAPAWGAIIAIVNQGRATAGQGTLDGGSQTLPGLYRLPSSDFHAVAAGSLVSTGLGTPNGPGLVNDLAFSGATASTNVTASRVGSAGSAAVKALTGGTFHRHSYPLGTHFHPRFRHGI
jgi:subtilase family serine protease